LVVPPRDDPHDTEDEPNGTPAILAFSSPMHVEISEEAEDETEEQESDEPAGKSAPQNGPIAGVGSVAVAIARKPETAPVHQASVAAAAPAVKGIAAEDLDRLKQALGELEACRRLLDKANEGGR
jgi:hypothetical protein